MLKNHITQANHVKYLRAYLDDYFSWEYQIKHIDIKVNKNDLIRFGCYLTQYI